MIPYKSMTSRATNWGQADKALGSFESLSLIPNRNSDIWWNVTESLTHSSILKIIHLPIHFPLTVINY